MEVDKYAELYKRRNKYRFKKKYLFILIAFIAILTNPSEDSHKKAVKAKFDNYIETHSGSPLSSMKGNPFVEQTISMSVNSTSYLFFSTTNVAWNDDTYVIGIGIFGKVFISDRIDSYLSHGYN